MKILMLLSNPFTHDPRVYNEAVSLHKAGHDVTVIGWDRDSQHPEKETIDGINVVRTRNTGYMKALPYDIFRLRPWWRQLYKIGKQLHEKFPFDAVHCHDLDTLPAGIMLKKKFGINLIYDAHEIWGYMVARDIPQWWANSYLKKEKKWIKAVNRIITVNMPLKEYFNGITNLPVTIVMNCKPLQGMVYEPPVNEKFTLIYIGTLGKSRFVLELVDILGDMPDTNCIIGGWGKHEYVNELKNKISKTNNVQFLGLIPPENVLPLTKKSDVVVCMTNPNDGNNSIASANKQFEAMVSGRPIICTEETYPGEFTIKENIGITAEYTNKSLKNAIIKLRDDPDLRLKLGLNALNAAVREYNWDGQEKALIDLYESLRKAVQ